MVSMVVSRNVELYNQWGAASAVGVVLLVCVLAIFMVVGRIVPLEQDTGAEMKQPLIAFCSLRRAGAGYLILPLLIIVPMSFSGDALPDLPAAGLLAALV